MGSTCVSAATDEASPRVRPPGSASPPDTSARRVSAAGGPVIAGAAAAPGGGRSEPARRRHRGVAVRGAGEAIMTDIRVLVVEDNFYTRLGTVAFLRDQPGVAVVGEAPDGERALALFAELSPDVTLVDLRMPGMGG